MPGSFQVSPRRKVQPLKHCGFADLADQFTRVCACLRPSHHEMHGAAAVPDWYCGMQQHLRLDCIIVVLMVVDNLGKLTGLQLQMMLRQQCSFWTASMVIVLWVARQADFGCPNGFR